ncbi:MAG: family 20 glycosylhydrolase [Bacteroidota bacterium]
MKKVLKILGFVLLGILLLTSGILWFFNTRYHTVNSEIKAQQKVLDGEATSFYRFDLNQNAIPEWTLLPLPKHISYTKEEQFQWPLEWEVVSELPDAERWVDRLLSSSEKEKNKKARILFSKDQEVIPQGYKLVISPSEITISYGDAPGAYYALVTLHHLRQQFPDTVECVSIEDYPDMEVRGVMLDISRDKVPKYETLLALVEKLSLLKYNHLQLYVEGFSFAYPSFTGLWEGKETPITPDEVQRLDAFCQERFIELVPNQNSLGHMQAWLETPPYAHLAECPDGYELLPLRKVKTTLDPTNAESIELVEKMMKDMLPHFKSDKFNANLDEPFELGHCNSAALAEEIGVGQLYLDFVLKVYELASAEGKSLWMWADIIGKHPELLDQLPKDITLLEWGYETEHPFDETTERIQSQGLDFLVCPGTSSWMTLTGRTDNMLGNIENAVINGIKNKAKGMLLTDWGDMGHWQYLPISYPGFTYAGAISWNSSSTRDLPLERYMNTYWFNDENQKMAKIVMDLGRSYHFEERHLPNMSLNFMAYQFGVSNPVLETTIYDAIQAKLPELVGDSIFENLETRFTNQKEFQVDALFQHLTDLETDLNAYIGEQNLFPDTNTLNDEIQNELRNGIQMVRLGVEIRNYGKQKENWTSEQRLAYLNTMRERLGEIQDEHRRLWLLRNKEGGLERSMMAFKKLEDRLEQLITVEEGGTFGRKIENFKERIISGGAHWYLTD